MNVRSPHVRPPPTDQEAHAGRPDAPRARRREQPPERPAAQPDRRRPRLSRGAQLAWFGFQLEQRPERGRLEQAPPHAVAQLDRRNFKFGEDRPRLGRPRVFAGLPLPGQPLAQLLEAVDRVEDPTYHELRGDDAVPAVLHQPTPFQRFSISRNATSYRASRRKRSTCAPRPNAIACPESRPRWRMRNRRCLPSPTVDASAISQPSTSRTTPGFPRPNGASRPSSEQRSRLSLAPGTIASTRVTGRRSSSVSTLSACSANAAANPSMRSRAIVSPAAARCPPKPSRCAAQAPSPPCRSKAGTDRPEPFQAPSVPAIITTGRP